MLYFARLKHASQKKRVRAESARVKIGEIINFTSARFLGEFSARAPLLTTLVNMNDPMMSIGTSADGKKLLVVDICQLQLAPAASAPPPVQSSQAYTASPSTAPYPTGPTQTMPAYPVMNEKPPEYSQSELEIHLKSRNGMAKKMASFKISEMEWQQPFFCHFAIKWLAMCHVWF